MTIQSHDAIEFPSARKAAEYAAAHEGKGLRALTDGIRNAVVPEAEAHRFEREGFEFAYLAIRDGRVITVPVN